MIDLVKEFDNLKQMKAEDQNQGAAALPLHEMMPSKGRNAINTTLIFKHNGSKMTPGSKVRIYSDAD